MKVVVSPTLVPGLIRAFEDLKEERRLDLDLRVYYPHQIDDEEIDPDEFGAELRSADAVLIDLMGAGGASIDLISRNLKDEKNTVVSLIVPMGRAFQEMRTLTRLGSFRGKGLAERMAGMEMMSGSEEGDRETLRKRCDRSND